MRHPKEQRGFARQQQLVLLLLMGQRKQKKKKAGKGGGGREPQRQPEPEPEPEPEPAASAENAEGDSEAARQARLEKMEPAGQGDEGRQHFRVINRAFVRSDFEMNSVREGTVEVGEEIEALEMRQNENGVVRVRFERGWVSATAGGSGKPLLERLPDEPLEGGGTLVASPSSSSLSSWGSADEGAFAPHTLCPLCPS